VAALGTKSFIWVKDQDVITSDSFQVSTIVYPMDPISSQLPVKSTLIKRLTRPSDAGSFFTCLTAPSHPSVCSVNTTASNVIVIPVFPAAPSLAFLNFTFDDSPDLLLGVANVSRSLSNPVNTRSVAVYLYSYSQRYIVDSSNSPSGFVSGTFVYRTSAGHFEETFDTSNLTSAVLLDAALSNALRLCSDESNVRPQLNSTCTGASSNGVMTGLEQFQIELRCNRDDSCSGYVMQTESSGIQYVMFSSFNHPSHGTFRSFAKTTASGKSDILYVLHHTELSWTEAAAYCRAHGGELVTILDHSENAAVAKLQTQLTTLDSPLAWIGLSSEVGWDNWHDGSRVLLQSWVVPPAANSTGCVVAISDGTHLVWNTLDCAVAQPFVYKTVVSEFSGWEDCVTLERPLLSSNNLTTVVHNAIAQSAAHCAQLCADHGLFLYGPNCSCFDVLQNSTAGMTVLAFRSQTIASATYSAEVVATPPTLCWAQGSVPSQSLYKLAATAVNVESESETNKILAVYNPIFGASFRDIDEAFGRIGGSLSLTFGYPVPSSTLVRVYLDSGRSMGCVSPDSGMCSEPSVVCGLALSSCVVLE